MSQKEEEVNGLVAEPVQPAVSTAFGSAPAVRSNWQHLMCSALNSSLGTPQSKWRGVWASESAMLGSTLRLDVLTRYSTTLAAPDSAAVCMK